MHNVEELIQQIEKDGYAILPSLINKATIDKLLSMCKEWHEKSVDNISDAVPFLNRDQANVYNLQDKDFFFLDVLFQYKEIEAILKHFLNDKWFKQIPQDEPNYILRSYGARSSNSGLPLHIDSFIPYVGEHLVAMQCSFVLEDQTPENGCTTIIPGSHQSGKYASKEATPDAIPIYSKAGDVVIWDSRTWHGTTSNTSDKTRWAIISTFVRWWVKQMFNITDNLPQNIYEKLTDNQKAILGFCSVPYNNESEGIDMKRGYENLEKEVSRYKN